MPLPSGCVRSTATDILLHGRWGQVLTLGSVEKGVKFFT